MKMIISMTFAMLAILPSCDTLNLGVPYPDRLEVNSQLRQACIGIDGFTNDADIKGLLLVIDSDRSAGIPLQVEMANISVACRDFVNKGGCATCLAIAIGQVYGQ